MPRKDRKPPTDEGGSATKLSVEALRDNDILQNLDGTHAALIVERGDVYHMPTKYMVYRSGEQILDALFPMDCVLSVVTQMADGEAIEVGTIGREGTSAIPVLMEGTTTENDCYCQAPGRAIRIPVEVFHEVRTTDSAFRSSLNRYLQAYVNFLGQLTACNRLHDVEERCARWLLLTQDRVGRDVIPLTHEYLAMMLGSRRSGVSLALGTLRRAGYIDYTHGSIAIADRMGLLSTTCECYAVAQKQFSSLRPPLEVQN